MINAALQFLVSQLNQYLRRKFSAQENVAIVSKMMDNDGRESESATNKLVMFLANVEKDSMTDFATSFIPNRFS